MVGTVVDEVEAYTAPVLRTALTRTIHSNRRVCCCLDRTGFARAADETGCRFTVRGVRGIIAQVSGIAGLDAVLAGRA